MEIEIKIIINDDEFEFNSKRELISDIHRGFSNITGYEIQDIEIKTIDTEE